MTIFLLLYHYYCTIIIASLLFIIIIIIFNAVGVYLRIASKQPPPDLSYLWPSIRSWITISPAYYFFFEEISYHRISYSPQNKQGKKSA